MAHPHHQDAKRTQAAKIRGAVGSGAEFEYSRDKARRLAFGEKRVVGDPSPPDQPELEQK